MIRIKRKETDYICKKINQKFGSEGNSFVSKGEYFEQVDTVYVTQPDIEIVNQNILSWVEQLKKYNKKAKLYDKGLLDDSKRKGISF